MLRRALLTAGAWLVAAAFAGTDATAQEWTGFFAIEGRGFWESAAESRQDQQGTASVVLEPELYVSWQDDRQSLVVRPFLRWDSADDERTHFDLRELYWRRVGSGWELDIGLRKVFWGVTESIHLVDIVNQTDLVEDIDGEAKLGQPMIRLGLSRDWGLLELFLLPGFRERTFPGAEGRLRFPLVVDEGDAVYESSAEEGHVDAAVRWSHFLGPVDLGLSYFRGTSREPDLLPRADGRLTPFYAQLDQAGIDLQATLGSWLLKTEAVARWRRIGDDSLAAAAGFEYTFGDIRSTGLDLGLLAEYLWGERELTPFEDDLFIGARLALNDVQSTEVLAGVVTDLGDGGQFFNVEASRRLTDHWEAELKVRAFAGLDERDPLAGLRRDDYLELRLVRFF
ncbi:MAG: hypothetical protein AAF604_17990 [Acidobacteriota bacterium]